MPRRVAVRWVSVVPAALAAAYLGVIAALTLGPGATDSAPSGPLWWMVEALHRLPGTGWISFDRFEFCANIALFAPLGLLLILWWGPRRGWYVLMCGLVVTIAIELSQRHIPGRVSDPRDVASNTLGTIVGILVGLAVARLRRRAGSPRRG